MYNNSQENTYQYHETETRNWQEVLAGALIAAAGLYFVTRGLEPRRERHNLSLSSGNPETPGIHVQESVSVNRSAQDLYDYWRDLGNLPQVMQHLKSVEALSDNLSHWVAKGPFGDIAWDARITYDNEGKSIAWSSVAGAQVPNEGSVHFREEPNGMTDVRVSLTYHPPLGPVGAAVAKLFGEEPAQQVRGDLQRFKERMETGKVES